MNTQQQFNPNQPTNPQQQQPTQPQQPTHPNMASHYVAQRMLNEKFHGKKFFDSADFFLKKATNSPPTAHKDQQPHP